jgi:hypothetical protein
MSALFLEISIESYGPIALRKNSTPLGQTTWPTSSKITHHYARLTTPKTPRQKLFAKLIV